MTDASPSCFAALTLALYRPLLRKAGPAPPGVRLPDVRTPHPRMRSIPHACRCSTT